MLFLLALLVVVAAAVELTPLQLAALKEKQRLERLHKTATTTTAKPVQTPKSTTTTRPRFTLPPPKNAKHHNPEIPDHLAHRYNKRDDMHVGHCLGADDARELQNHKIEASERRLPPPRTRILWPHIDVIEVEVTLPYVADQFRYVLSFAPVQTDSVSDRPVLDPHSRCSSFYKATRSYTESEYDTSDDAEPAVQDWVFAPNALYPNAFGPDYTASYVSEESIWKVEPVDCAHVRYTAKIPLSQLLECQDAAAIVNEKNNTALITSLHVVGLIAGHNLVAYKHEYGISVYSDSQGNAVMIFDSSSSESKPPGATLMRFLEIDDDDKLSLQLQTVSETGHLRLESVTPRYSSPDGALTTSPLLHAVEENPETYGSGQQNWDFSAKLTETMFTGQYVMQFAAKETKESLLVGIMFRIDNAPAVSDEQLSGIHGAVAQHKKGDSNAHTGKFTHGETVCMQSYVLIGNDLEQHIQVDLIDAALCPAGQIGDCRQDRHGVVLFADGKPQRTDVKVTWPGAYGENSIELCFNASADLVDGEHRSYIFEKQRYEARVAIRAHNAAARQASLAWQKNRDAHEPSHLKQRVKLIKAQIVKGGDYTNGNLENSLLDARAAQMLEDYENQFAEFEVERTESSLYNVSNSDALIVTGLILAIVIVVILVYAILVYSSGRRAHQDLASSLDNRYKS
jgi:hypothetical protein